MKTRIQGRDPSGSYPDIHSWFVTGGSCRRWWAGARDYNKNKSNIRDNEKENIRNNPVNINDKHSCGFL